MGRSFAVTLLLLGAVLFFAAMAGIVLSRPCYAGPMHVARTLSVSLARSPADVYAFVSEPANLPRWAAGLDPSLPIRFAEKNAFGVLDHWVSLPDGTVVYVPVRVIANGDGSELSFTLFDAPAGDVAMVERDLQALKALLEAR